MAGETFNLPQLIAVLVIGFLALRWLFSSSTTQGAGSRANGRQVTPAQVEQVCQMFPQLDRRTIMWDLQQNGGSVQGTTERILSGRALVQPPPSFRPALPTSAAPSNARPSQAKAPLPDLITRFGLASKLSAGQEAQAQAPATADSKQTGWSQNKTERSELMRRRKEEMVLAARRKMEAQDRLAKSSS